MILLWIYIYRRPILYLGDITVHTILEFALTYIEWPEIFELRIADKYLCSLVSFSDYIFIKDKNSFLLFGIKKIALPAPNVVSEETH